MVSLKTKTTLAANDILQCHCRAGESWPADCSKAAVQSSGCKAPVAEPRVVLVRGTQHVSMSADRSRRRPAWDKLTVIDKIVRDKLTVIDKICCSWIEKCLDNSNDDGSSSNYTATTVCYLYRCPVSASDAVWWWLEWWWGQWLQEGAPTQSIRSVLYTPSSTVDDGVCGLCIHPYSPNFSSYKHNRSLLL